MPLAQRSVEEFIMLLASKEPAPGGGSASALLGAVGTALSSMVANLTVGKDKYKDYEEHLQEFLKELESLNKDFLSLIEEDTNAFSRVARAYKMPKETEEQKLARNEAIEKSLKEATLVPVYIMEKCISTLRLIDKTFNMLNLKVISDIGVSVLCLRSALQGGWLNVMVNLKSIKDEEFREEIGKKCEDMLKEGLELADKIYSDVEKLILK